jgi:hypothetical protein
MTAIFYLLTLVLPLATILIVFRMRYRATAQETQARLAGDEAYRQLAEKASAVQAQMASSLAAMEANLADLRSRVSAVETILKAVE